MKIIFIRHGESTVNVAGVFSNRRDFPLTARGRDQVRVAAELVSDMYPSVGFVYSSPFTRAQESAVIIRDTLNTLAALPGAGHGAVEPIISIDERLRELSVGHLEGKSGDEAQDIFDRIWTEWYANGNFDYYLPGGESGNSIRERVAAFVNETFLRHGASGCDIIALSHGGVMKCALPQLASNLLQAEIQKHWLDNADIATLEITPAAAKTDSPDDAAVLLNRGIAGLGIRCLRYGNLKI